MPLANYIKDPEAVLEYPFDWNDWLADSETITSYVVTVPAGLTLNADGQASGVVTPWISGGTAGQSYRVECKVTTSEGRTDERSVSIMVQER